ncbi:MAG TPA: hypothetical protein VIM49_13220, partial [Dermatophilaceae bacterium]
MRMMVGRTRVIERGLWARFLVFVVSLGVALVANALFISATPASADPRPTAPVVDADSLTPQQITDQVKAAEALR